RPCPSGSPARSGACAAGDARCLSRRLFAAARAGDHRPAEGAAQGGGIRGGRARRSASLLRLGRDLQPAAPRDLRRAEGAQGTHARGNAAGGDRRRQHRLHDADRRRHRHSGGPYRGTSRLGDRWPDAGGAARAMIRRAARRAGGIGAALAARAARASRAVLEVVALMAANVCVTCRATCLGAIFVLVAAAPLAAQIPLMGAGRAPDAAEEIAFRGVGRVTFAGRGFCTGSLIASRLVLTAAHCLYDARSLRPLPLSLLRFVPAAIGGLRPQALRIIRTAAAPSFHFDGRPVPEAVAADLALLELADA